MTTPTSQASGPGALTVRAVRGAVQVASDDPALIEQATGDLLGEILRRNGLGDADLISIVFTTTHDLRSAFPAAAARKLGLIDVPLLCTAEIAVPGSLHRVVRILAHVHSRRPREAMHHVYLGAAAALRPDLGAPAPTSDVPLPQGA
ncbi:chorismate mutase [Streptomyces sp. NPDC001815]|uniref:chorismate mutase n=1 Tax=Streptomyces sp. NPDC001815 TaxID=3154526 RepID=UPI003318AE2F